MDTEKEIFFGVFDKFTNKCYFTGSIQPAELISSNTEIENLQLWTKNILAQHFTGKPVEVSVSVASVN